MGCKRPFSLPAERPYGRPPDPYRGINEAYQTLSD